MLAVGINHKTAPVALRERAAFSSDKTPAALKQLLQLDAVNEAIILSTCNRTEVYSDSADSQQLQQWLAEFHQLPSREVLQHSYSYQHQAAVSHIMRVACGLDSMILGEPQILGQMKQAYVLAQQAGTVGSAFGRLFPTVFNVSKQVRTDTGIGNSSLSLASAAISLSKHLFSDLSKRTVLLIGAGDIIEMMAMHCAAQGVKRIIVANRTVEKAEKIAKPFHGHAIKLADMPVYLAESDIVVTATASQLPVLGKGAIESAIKVRKHRPMFMLDLAVPRDIEPEVSELEDVYLYNIDDLQQVVNENLKNREDSSELARELIDLHTARFMRELQALDAVQVVRDYRNKIINARDDVLQHAKQQLARGADPDAVLEALARSLTNKVMHDPTVQLRQAAFDGRPELLLLARKLFDL